MTAHKHGYYQTATREPPARSWANEGDQMAKRKGWTKKDNERYREQLRLDRKLRQVQEDEKKIDLCDHCVTGDHGRCWRVVCYCPCIHDRMKARSGWPAP